MNTKPTHCLDCDEPLQAAKEIKLGLCFACIDDPYDD